MMNVQRVGLKSEFLLKRNFLVSKFLTKNSFTFPVCKRIRITFPLYESESLLRSRSIIIMVEFLEQFAGVRAIIKKANLIVGSGLWVRGQVDLSDFSLSKFFLFFNEYFLSHPLLRFSSKLPFLRTVNYNYVKLVISDIDSFLIQLLDEFYLIQNIIG